MTHRFPTPPGYRVLPHADIPSVVSEIPELCRKLGGSSDDWRTVEVSDGNMNAVYRVTGPAGSIIVKQALPYIRVIENWPFPVSRIAFEAEALKRHLSIAPGRVPASLHYDEALGLLVMEDLNEHQVARLAFIEGRMVPNFAEHMGEFLARSLYFTSDFYLTTPDKKALAARFAGNSHLCQTTEEVIFTGPYGTREFNRVTDGNEEIAAEFRADDALKRAATQMKFAFRSKSEALIHGDLHTGSVMVTDTDTRVIDAEWAFHGPMGFDIGALIGNLFLAAISQPGHASETDDRSATMDWLLKTAADVWTSFEAQFKDLALSHETEFFPPDIFDRAARLAVVDVHLRAVFADTLGFAGAKMIRRIIGISHVEDFETIAHIPTRASLERHALRTARRLLLERSHLQSVEEAIAIIKAEANDPDR